MLDNENFVEETTENAEVTAEETQVVEQPTEKTYTEADFEAAVNTRVDEVLGKKIARKEAKIRKEYERKYGELENVLRAGTGKESIGEITDTFANFYESKGIKIRKDEPNYTDKDIEILATAEANDIINAGYEEVVDEVDRLAEIGVENMTARERAYFNALSKHRLKTERHNELAKIGVTEDVYNGKEFQDFAKQFNSTTPIADIYNIYKQTLPKKEFKTAGSMKHNTADTSGVKDFYSYEEAMKFTQADFDKNPELFKAVEASMQKWK
jgi:hypothetical protein